MNLAMMMRTMAAKDSMPKAKELTMADMMPVSVDKLRYQMDSGEFKEMERAMRKKKKEQKIKQAEELNYDRRNYHRSQHDDVFRPR